jgi:hypothetical protein
VLALGGDAQVLDVALDGAQRLGFGALLEQLGFTTGFKAVWKPDFVPLWPWCTVLFRP